ncbi:MAG: type II secretion system F family protein [Oscillospiraceae bacterium]|nr:type II secretion system F family protein [Oscillospiraceae bacterium]MCR4760839.1 type II secretion system F family protein [Oscillospiraceae bacterium]
MPMSFTYTAKDAVGNIRKGVMTAEDEQEFLAKIREKGMYVTEYKERQSNVKTVKKFKTKDLAFATRQMAAMLTSGLTLVKALDILCKEQESEAARNVWRDVYENVQKGESFSDSLEVHGSVFPTLMTSMVGAGEASGQMDIIMQRLSDYYANQNKISNTIKSAMVYPIILAVLTVAVVIGVFVFIMPTFSQLYDDESKMPALSRAMMNIGKFMVKHWLILVLLLFAIIFVSVYMLKLPDVRMKWDRFIIKGPAFGKLVVKIYTARFAQTMASLYSSGLPMVECLKRSADTLNNSYISMKFRDIVDEVKSGETLSSSIQRADIFDSMFCSIIYVGEESGALDEILAKTAEYYDEEADSAVKRLCSLLEPLMLIIMGIVIGLVCAAFFPALYESIGQIG